MFFKDSINILRRIPQNNYKAILLIFLISLLFRLPFYQTPFWRTPDAAEYIDVARNILQGEGLTQSIKFLFFDDIPVISSALFNRPILTSLVFTGILKLHNNLYSIQLFLLILGAINSVLFYILSRKLLTPFFAFVVSLLATTNPNLLINNRLVLSEPIFYSIILFAFIVYYTKSKSRLKYVLLGFLSGLAYLSRPEGLLFLLIVVGFHIRQGRVILLILLSFFITIFPYLALNYGIDHNPLKTNNAYYWQVKHISEGMQAGYDKIYPSAYTFIKQNFVWIILKIGNNFYENLKSLISDDFLGLLTLYIIFIRRDNLRKFFPILTYVFLNIAVVSFTWSIFYEPQRHLGLVYLLLLIIFGNVIYLQWRKKVIVILLILTFLMYIPLDIHRITWARTVEKYQDPWDPVKREKLYRWIQQNTSPKDIIAISNTHVMSIHTARPAILLPSNILNKRLFNVFTSQFHVKYIVAENKEQKNFFKQNAILVIEIDDLVVFKVKPK